MCVVLHTFRQKPQKLRIQNFIESSIEAGLVIGFLPCPVVTFPSGCSPVDLGTILFNGPFNPVQNGRVFSEDFTVTIPHDAPAGDAQIAIARFFLIGVSQVWHIMIFKKKTYHSMFQAGNSPTIGQANVTVNVL